MSFLSVLGSFIKGNSAWLGQDRLRRQELYRKFIQQASKSANVDALQHEKPDVPLLVVLYGKISRMRVISSPQVLAAAEQVLRRIVDVYFKPPVVSVALRFVRCSKTDQSTFFATSANVVEPNSTCSHGGTLKLYETMRAEFGSSSAVSVCRLPSAVCRLPSAVELPSAVAAGLSPVAWRLKGGPVPKM